MLFIHLSRKLALLHPRAQDFIDLTRLNRPIGIYLLLWPTLSALLIAADGMPSLLNLLVFVLGVVLTRSAGCAINDYADRHFDAHVKRTSDRPLASGRLHAKEALWVFAILMLVCLGLVLLTNLPTILLSVGAIVLAAIYPFMKRHTHYPQAVLGAAYSWGILMCFTAERGELPAAAWLLYLANVLWTVAYDTYYAMTDRDDDLRIGIKSTAIRFGERDRHMIAILQGVSLVLLLAGGLAFGLGAPFILGLIAAAGCYVWEYRHTSVRDRDACFRAFLHNHWAGLAVLAGVLIDYLVN